MERGCRGKKRKNCPTSCWIFNCVLSEYAIAPTEKNRPFEFSTQCVGNCRISETTFSFRTETLSNSMLDFFAFRSAKV